jgi:hypothetical protein
MIFGDNQQTEKEQEEKEEKTGREDEEVVKMCIAI